MPYKLEDFEVLKLIGSGSFASCYKVVHKNTRETLVWKVMEYGGLSEEQKQLLVTEVTLLRDLRHPNIVNYYDRIIQKDTKQLYILMEYCQGGDLATLINTCKRGGSFVEENFIWRVLFQLSSALEACQSWLLTSIVLHRDVKPANVFLDENGNVKLGDFGLARKLDLGQTGCSETRVGTPFYMSPEVMKGEIYNCKSDVWSLGCLVYELCALSPPFHARNIKELATKVNSGRFSRIPAHYSESLNEVLCRLLVVNQEQRPSTTDLVHDSVILAHVHQQLDSKTKHLDRCVKASSRSTVGGATNKAPPPSPADREPEEVSKETFRGEWLSRLQCVREREAVLRDREHRMEEREHALTRREHKVALLERTVRDKLALAEVYLKRCREGRSMGPGSRHPLPQDLRDVDESFSADPGDTSVLPTTTRLDPAVLIKPATFTRMASERRVHFNDYQPDPSLSLPKPVFLKVAEAIRGSTSKGTEEWKPKMEQRVLNLPGYTGPAITVDVPIYGTQEKKVLSAESIRKPTPSSPAVKLTVLFDDREDLRKATNANKQIDALDLHVEHTKRFDQNCGHLKKNPSVESLDRECSKQNYFGSVQQIKHPIKITKSFDSLLDDSLVKHKPNNMTKCLDSLNLDLKRREMSLVSVNPETLKKNAFGGSTRRTRRKSGCRSSTPLSSDSKSSLEQQKIMAENAINDAVVQSMNKVSIAQNTQFEQQLYRRPYHPINNKENVPCSQTRQHGQKSTIKSTVLALPSLAAAALTSRKKTSSVHFR